VDGFGNTIFKMMSLGN